MADVKIRSAGRKGRGVFITGAMGPDILVLRNLVLPIKKPHTPKVEKSVIGNYAFYLSGIYMICLGEGCLLNHSLSPNLTYCYNKKTKTIDFWSSCFIPKGQELTIDYGWESYSWQS